MSVKSPNVSLTVYAAITYDLSIAVNKTTGYVGETFTFTGRFMMFDPAQGAPSAVPNWPIALYVGGSAVKTGNTDGNGYYSLTWTPTTSGNYTAYTQASTAGLAIESDRLSVGVLAEGVVAGNVASLLLGALGVLVAVASVKKKR